MSGRGNSAGERRIKRTDRLGGKWVWALVWAYQILSDER